LKEMGFPESRCVKALQVVNNSSVEAAMNWIFEHMDDPDIDTASSPAASTPATDTNAVAADTPSGATVHNAMCDQCQKQIVGIRYKCKNRPDYDLCEACKAKGEFDPSLEFDAHSEDIVNPALTPEERALQIEKLNQRIAEVKRKKAEDEEKREKERELQRRHGGKESIEAKKKWEDAQAAREAEKIRKEKEDEKRAKERIKQKIEQDKLDRAAKNKKVSAEPAAQPAPTPVQPAQPVQQKTYTEAQVQIRLTDGSTIKATFLPTDTLRQVFTHVEAHRTDGKGNFTLMTTFPRKIYTKNDFNVTLQEAGLVPNGTLVVTKA